MRKGYELLVSRSKLEGKKRTEGGITGQFRPWILGARIIYAIRKGAVQILGSNCAMYWPILDQRIHCTGYGGNQRMTRLKASGQGMDAWGIGLPIWIPGPKAGINVHALEDIFHAESEWLCRFSWQFAALPLHEGDCKITVLLDMAPGSVLHSLGMTLTSPGRHLSQEKADSFLLGLIK